MVQSLQFVIFGFGGDLSKRKLVPALAQLYATGKLPTATYITAIGRREYSLQELNAIITDSVNNSKDPLDPTSLVAFCSLFSYLQMDIARQDDYAALQQSISSIHAQKVIYYYAITPSLYGPVSKNLHSAHLTSQTDGEKIVIVEKPFGSDVTSSEVLNAELHACFSEDQIYRIDHYLGKETVQNILVTRFANSIFEPLWNRNYIDYIEISALESVPVGTRAGYYEGAGALRDMVQNHLLQVLALIAMEPPVCASANCLRNEMVKVFQSLHPLSESDVRDNVVRGQYVHSEVQGKEEIGYHEEHGVAPDSKTETYVALKCFIDNWRWSGIPFYIRTGKALRATNSEVVVHFKDNPHRIFSKNENLQTEPNMLIIRIQPDEGVVLSIDMKVPGYGFEIEQVDLGYHYSKMEDHKIADSYVRLLYDAINSDPTLYQRSDAIELTWKYVDPILKAWEKDDTIPVHEYNRGTWGPEGVEQQLTGNGAAWRTPCKNTDANGMCEL